MSAIPGALSGALRTGRCDAYCPHCFLLVKSAVGLAWPVAPERCPHCRLLIGAGRGRTDASATPGARGTAAGVFAHRAERSEEPASTEAINAAIRRVADELGLRAERLLMVDYQQRATRDIELPPLGDVLDAHGSWKRARRAAAGG